MRLSHAYDVPCIIIFERGDRDVITNERPRRARWCGGVRDCRSVEAKTWSWSVEAHSTAQARVNARSGLT